MKELIIDSIVVLIVLFVMAGADFKLKPFHLRFSNPYIAIGAALILIGVFFIYYQGTLNGEKELMNDLKEAANSQH